MLVLFIFSPFSPAVSQAEEVDSFTGWLDPLEDSTDKVNELVNQRIKSAIYAHNVLNHAKSCKPEKIIDMIYSYIGGNPWGKMELIVAKSKSIQSQKLKSGQSIYKGIKFTDGPITAVGVGCCSPVVNIAGSRIGTDKIGHFFGQGMTYYNLVHGKMGVLDLLSYGYQVVKDGFTPTAALKWGLFTELYALYGKPTTGVGSFGDLAANYRGMLFWNNLLEGVSPHLRCEGNQYVVARPFDFRDYVDDGWDEAVNCSEYRTQTMVAKVKSNLEDMTLKRRQKFPDSPAYTCPMKPNPCPKLAKSYDKAAPFILSPICKLDRPAR